MTQKPKLPTTTKPLHVRRHHTEPTKKTTLYIPMSIHTRLGLYLTQHPEANFNETVITAILKLLDEADIETTTKRLYTNKLAAKIDAIQDEVINYLKSKETRTDADSITPSIQNLLELTTLSIMMTAGVARKVTLLQNPKDDSISDYDILERALRDYGPDLPSLAERLHDAIHKVDPE